MSNIKEAINILECIAKFDNTESQDIKARYFDVIQNDIKKLLADRYETCLCRDLTTNKIYNVEVDKWIN